MTHQRDVVRRVLRTTGRPLSPTGTVPFGREPIPALDLAPVSWPIASLVSAGQLVAVPRPASRRVMTQTVPAGLLGRPAEDFLAGQSPGCVTGVPAPTDAL